MVGKRQFDAAKGQGEGSAEETGKITPVAMGEGSDTGKGESKPYEIGVEEMTDEQEQKVADAHLASIGQSQTPTKTRRVATEH